MFLTTISGFIFNSLEEIVVDIDTNVNVGDSFLVNNVESCRQYLTDPEKKINLIFQNIRSIDCNFDDFTVLINRSKIDFDLIFLTECWLQHLQNIPVLPNFTAYTTQNHINQNSGVVVYARNSLNVNIVEPKIDDADSLIVKLGNDHAFICIYRSPSIHSLDRFLSSLSVVIDSVKAFPNTYVLGDINVDIKDNNDDPRSAIYLDLLAMHGLLPSHLFPTHGPNCIDHFFAKINDKTLSIVCKSSVTDHSSVVVSVAKKGDKKTKPQLTTTRVDYENVVNDLKDINWSDLFNSNDPNVATSIFLSTVSSVIEKHTSVHTIPKRKAILKPWITPGLIRCMRWRDRLHQKHKKNPENVVLLLSYKRYRNYCTNILHKLKRTYERSELNKHHNNIKKTWTIIKQICNFNSNTDSPSELLNIKKTPKDSAEFINNFFVSVGSSLANKTLNTLDQSEMDLASKIKLTNGTPFSITLLPTDDLEIRKIILNMKSSSATGRDGISSIFFKHAVQYITQPIVHITNLCLDRGIFPLLLKEAIVIPVHKSGDRGSIDNYRPISLLPALAKIIEKVINSRLLNFLESHGLLSNNQFGFRHNTSTTDAIESMVTHVVEKMDNHRKCLGIYLDLAKAFDTVSIPILIRKLECIGVRGVPLQLLIDYLSNRTQSVRVGGELSCSASVSFGVPQGSVLGPTLFLVYINELCKKELKNAKIVTFADDTVVLFDGSSWDEVKSLAEQGFSEIIKWLNSNLLTLNYTKTKYITFSIRNNTQPLLDLNLKAHACDDPTICNCYVLTPTNSVKYLGLVVDRNLRWTDHIHALSKRIRKLMCIFKKIKHINDNKIIKMTYFALCESIISYGIVSWGGTDKSRLIKVERAQRGVLKVAFSKKFRYPTIKLYEESNVLTVRQLYIKYLVLRQNTYAKLDVSTKRLQHKVYISPTLNTKFAQNFAYFRGPYIYNLINKYTNLSGLSRQCCKTTLVNYLKGLNYSSTEDLLIIID